MLSLEAKRLYLSDTCQGNYRLRKAAPLNRLPLLALVSVICKMSVARIWFSCGLPALSFLSI